MSAERRNEMRPILFLIIALVSATSWHFFLRRYWLASFAATITTVVLFFFTAFFGVLNLGPIGVSIQTLAIIAAVAEGFHLHFVGSFFLIVLVISFVGALVISTLIGLFLRVRRKLLKRETQSLQLSRLWILLWEVSHFGRNDNT